jgi:hypothetical protein
MYPPEAENEPNWVELVRFGSVRIDPNRTRTDFLQMHSNRTELELIHEKWTRTEPNSNRFSKNEPEPSRTRTNFEKHVNLEKCRKKWSIKLSSNW